MHTKKRALLSPLCPCGLGPWRLWLGCSLRPPGWGGAAARASPGTNGLQFAWMRSCTCCSADRKPRPLACVRTRAAPFPGRASLHQLGFHSAFPSRIRSWVLGRQGTRTQTPHLGFNTDLDKSRVFATFSYTVVQVLHILPYILPVCYVRCWNPLLLFIAFCLNASGLSKLTSCV